MLSIFFFYGGSSLAILRVVIGILMLVHGKTKLKDLKGTAAWFGSVGFRPGGFWGTLVALLETAGGAALILGLFVQPLAALFIIQFITIIIWKLKQRAPFVGGWEFDFVILGAMIVLLFLGSGSYALDRMF
jgi:putative oxidoreductase